jgi:hypothetical protein
MYLTLAPPLGTGVCDLVSGRVNEVTGCKQSSVEFVMHGHLQNYFNMTNLPP